MFRVGTLRKRAAPATQTKRHPAADSQRRASGWQTDVPVAPPFTLRLTSPKRLRWNIRRHRVPFFLAVAERGVPAPHGVGIGTRVRHRR